MQAIAWDLAKALAKDGRKITVVTAEIVARPPVFFDEGIKVIAIPGTSWRFYGRSWWRKSRSLFEQQLACDCEAVLSVSVAGIGLLPLRHRFPRVKFLMQAHGTSLGEICSKWKTSRPVAILRSMRNMAWLIRDMQVYSQFDAVVAIGSRVANELRAKPIRWVLSEEKMHVISNGIDVCRFRPDPEARKAQRAKLGWNEGDLVVVSASRLHKEKGIHLGMQAFARLVKKRKGARFLIIGEGAEQENLRKQARKLELEESVYFTGGVAREQLPVLLQAADVMLFTTLREEGLPLNVLEALAVGLPCVLSRHVLEGHELAANDHIHLVQPEDARAVAKAVLQAGENGCAGTSALPEEFFLATCASRYASLLAMLSAERLAHSNAMTC
jgi:glycosyltransferase involved in cell wall biosynthesis